jgi:hypothetical protein
MRTAMASVLALVAVDLPVSSAGRAPVLVRAFPAPAPTAGA